MTQVNKSSPPVQNFALLASWLGEPCHFNAKQHGLRESTLTHITAMNDVLHSDTGDSDNSDRIKAVNRGSLQSDCEIGRLTDKRGKESMRRYNKSLLPPDLQHPGVTTLLDEYYKLMTAQVSKNSQSVSAKYCPSFKTKMWQLMTAQLPFRLRFSSVINGIHSLAASTAPEQRMPIVAMLVAWLYLFKILILMEFVHPVIFVLFACIGVYVLSLSEEKLQAAMKRKLKPGHVLRQFNVGEHPNSYHSSSLHTFHKTMDGFCYGSATE